MIVVEEKDQEVNYLKSYVYYEFFCLFIKADMFVHAWLHSAVTGTQHI